MQEVELPLESSLEIKVKKAQLLGVCSEWKCLHYVKTRNAKVSTVVKLPDGFPTVLESPQVCTSPCDSRNKAVAFRCQPTAESMKPRLCSPSHDCVSGRALFLEGCF